MKTGSIRQRSLSGASVPPRSFPFIAASSDPYRVALNRIFLAVAVYLLSGLCVFADCNWDGDNAVGNFSNDDNWYSNVQPAWGSGSSLNFNLRNNGSQSSLYFNYGGWRDCKDFIYAGTFGAGLDLNGDGNGINVYGKIENQSSYGQNIKIPISIKNGTKAEIDPTSADLGMYAAIWNDGTKNLEVYGNNGHTLAMNCGWPSNNFGVKLIIQQNSIVRLLSPQNYTGNTEINAGEMWVDTSGQLSGSSTIYVGNGGTLATTAKLWLQSAGVAITNSITINNGNDTTRYIGGLNSSGSSYFGGAITMNGPTFLEANNAGGTVVFTGVVSGVYVLNKSGPGVVVLSAVNTHTSTNTVRAGTLQISADRNLGAVPALATENINLWDPSTFEVAGTFTMDANRRINVGTVNGPKISVTSGNTLTYQGQINNSANWSKESAGQITMTSQNIFSGTLTINAGVIRVQHTDALGTTAGGTVVASGAALEIQGTITTAAEPLTLNGTGVSSGGALRNTANNNTFAGAITLNTASRINSDSGTLTLTGGISGSGIGLTVGGAGDTTINSVIGTGSGTVTKDGAGTLILSAVASANTYTGLTTVNAGTMSLGKNATVNAFGGDLTISGGTVNYSTTQDNQIPDTVNVTLSSGTLAFGARNETIGSVGVSGSFTMSGGTLTLGGATLNLSRNPTISGGTATVTANGGIIQANTELTMNGGKIDLAGTTSAGATLNLRGGTGTGMTYQNTGTSVAVITNGTVSLNTAASATTVFTIGDAASLGNEMTIASTISGAGKNLQKSGAGTLTLSGTNSYSGSTTISAGTLIMNGSNTASAVSVSAGATNMGVGYMGSLAVSGQVAPGTNTIGVGVLTVSSLTMNNGSSFRCQLGNYNDTTDRDYINNTGAATINASVTVYVDSSGVSNWGNTQSKSWNIIVGSIASAANFTLDQTTYWDSGTYPKRNGTFSLSASGGNLVLGFTPAPDVAVLGTSLALIANGDVTPSTADGTDFGSIEVSGYTTDRVFTVTNSGSAMLDLSDVAIGGTDATNFWVSAALGITRTNMLLNRDFALNGTPAAINTATINNWTPWGASGYYNNDIGSQMSVKFWWDDSGIYQDFTCQPGGRYDFSVNARQASSDPLVSWHGYLKAEFYDAAWGPLAAQELAYIAPTSPADVWIPLSGTYTAPVNSAHGRMVLGINNWGAGAAGSAYFDDASVISRSLGVGTTTTFKVTFDPSSTGLKSATVYMTNNVSGKTPYSFAIQGTGTSAPVAGIIYDWFPNSGRLYNQGGGNGWGTTNLWIAANDDNQVYGSGSFATNKWSVHDTAGNKAQIVATVNGSQHWADRYFPTAFTSGTVYVSWMQNYDHKGNVGTLTALAGIFFLDTNQLEKPFIGKIPFTNALGIGYDGAPVTNSSRTMENGVGTDYVCVAKYDFATRVLSANAYSTNDMVAEEPMGYWDISVTLTVGCIRSIGGIRIKAGVDPSDAANNIGNAYFDELRIGTNFYQIARSQGEASSDVLVDGPVPKLIFLGTNYTLGATNDATITDAQLVNTSDKLDFAILWSNQYGVFMTNQNGSFNIGSRAGRVNPNWDPYTLSTSGVTNSLNYDSNFTGFVGFNGALTVTTYVQNAFNIMTSSVGDTYFLTASAENNNLNNGSIISPSSVSTVPVMRAITVNSQMFFTVTDDDSAPPVLAPPTLGMSLGANTIGNLLSDPGFNLNISSPWTMFGVGSSVISNGMGESGSPGVLLTIGTGAGNNGGFFQDYTIRENVSRRYIFAIRAKDGSSHFDCAQLILKLEFFDSNNLVIYAASNDIVTQVTTDWQTFSISATTTPSTVKVRPSVNFDTAGGTVGTVGRTNMWDNAKLYWATEVDTNPILRVTDGDLAAASPANPFNVAINGYDAYSGLARGTNNATTQSFVSVANLATNNVANYSPGSSSATSTNGDAISVWTWSNGFTAAAIQNFMNAGSNIVVTTLRDADSDRTDDQLSLSNRTAGYFAVVDDDTNIPLNGFTRTTELLFNPGFETNGLGWTNVDGALSVTGYTAVAAETGSYGLMITNSAGGVGWGYFGAQHVDVTPSSTYILSVRARKDGAVNIGSYFVKDEFYNGSGYIGAQETNIYTSLTASWQTFTLNVTEPGNVISNRIVFLFYAASAGDGLGSVYFDNASFKAVVGPPMTMQIGNTAIAGSDDTTNALYNLTDGDLAGINATNPMRLILAAYDTDSGLARTNTPGAEGSNTSVSVLNLTTNNVTNYVATESSPFPAISTSTNLWRWDAISASSLLSMYSAGSNAVRTTLKDADFDRTGDQLSGPANTLLGYLKLSDDDSAAPVLSGFYAALTSPPPAAASLVAGDIAIIGYNALDPDAFTFVTLTTMASGTVIKFTDNGWLAAGGFRAGEGTLLWSNTAPNGLAFGTMVTITGAQSAVFAASTGTVIKLAGTHNLAANDQLIAYQDTSSSTTFIFAINWNAGVWQADAPDSSSSALPTGLTNGLTAIAFGNLCASNVYNMSTTTASKVILLTAIGNTGNWTRTTVTLPPAGSFTQFIQITDGNLYNGNWWIAGLVQDTGSGVHSNSIATGPDFGVNYDLVSPSNVMVLTDVVFQLEQADGGGMTWPTSIASSVASVPQSANVLGVWTARVSAADNDNDRTGDRATVVDSPVLSFNVIDDDTNYPLRANVLGANLLVNGGFEIAGWWNGIAQGWDYTNGVILGATYGNYLRSDFRVKSGGYAASIPGNYGANVNTYGGWYQGVTNSYGPNSVWLGSVWARSDNNWTSGSTQLKIEFYQADNSAPDTGQNVTYLSNPSNGWQYATVVATCGAATAYARLVLGASDMGTNGSIYFDNAVLQVQTNTVLPMDVQVGNVTRYIEGTATSGVFSVSDEDLAGINATNFLKFVFRVYDTDSGVGRTNAYELMNYDIGALASQHNVFTNYNSSLSSLDSTVPSATSIFSYANNFTLGGYHSGTNFVENGEVVQMMIAGSNAITVSYPDADDDRGATDRLWIVDNQFGYLKVEDDDSTGPVATLKYIGTNFTPGLIGSNVVTDADMLGRLDFAVEWVDASGLFVTNNNGSQTNNADYGNVSMNWDLVGPDAIQYATDVIHPATSIFTVAGNGSLYATAVQYNVSQVVYTNNQIGNWTIQGSAQDEDNDRGSISYNNTTVKWDRAVRANIPMPFTVVDDDTDLPDRSVIVYTNETTNTSFIAYASGAPNGAGAGSNRAFEITDEEMIGFATNPLRMVFNVYDAYSGINRGSNDLTTNMSITVVNVVTNDVTNFNFSGSSVGTVLNTSTSQWTMSAGFPLAMINALMLTTSKVFATIPDADNDRIGDTLWRSNMQVGTLRWNDDDSSPPRLRSFGTPTTNPALSLYAAGSPSLGFAGTNAWVNPQTGGEITNKDMVFMVSDGDLARVSTATPLDLNIWVYDQENGLARDTVGATSNTALTIGSAIISNVASFVASNSAAFPSTKQIAQSSNLWRFTSIPYTQVGALYSAPGGSNQLILHALNQDFDRGAIDQDRIDTNLGWMVVRDDDSNYPKAHNLTINSKALTNLFTDEEMSTGFYLQVHLGDDVSGVYTATALGAFAPPTFSLLNASNSLVQTNTPFNVWSNNPQQLVNGGFETAGTNSLLADKWDWICYDTMGTWHRSNDMVRSGQYALSANFAGPGSNEVVHQWVSVTNMAVGEGLVFGGWLKISNSLTTSSRAVLKFEWWDVRTTNTCPTPAGTLQGFTVSSWYSNTANDWVNLEVAGTKPTVSSYWCKVICELTVIGGATNRLAFDDMYVGTPADLLAARGGVTVPYSNFALGTYSFEWTGQDSDNDRTNDTLGYSNSLNVLYSSNTFTVIDDDSNTPVAADLWVNGADADWTNSYVSDQLVHVGLWPISMRLSDYSGIVTNSANGSVPNYSLINSLGITVNANYAFTTLTDDGVPPGLATSLIAYASAGGVVYTNVTTGTYALVWSARDKDNDRADDWIGSTNSGYFNPALGTNIIHVYDDDTNGPSRPASVAVDITVWTNANLFNVSFNAATDDYSGIYQYRYDTNVVPSTTLTDGVPITGVATTILAVPASNLSYEIGYDGLALPQHPATVTNWWLNWGTDNATGLWSSAQHYVGTNSMRHMVAAGDNDGAARFVLIGEDVDIGNTNGYPVMASLSGWFKGDVSASANGATGTAFLKMEFLDSSTSVIMRGDNEWAADNDAGTTPLFGVNAVAWTNVTLAVTNAPAGTRYIRFLTGVAQHGTKLAYDVYWDDLSVTVQVVGAVGSSYSFTVTNVLEGVRSNSLFGVDDDNDRPNDRAKGLNTNFITMLDLTAPAKINGLVGTNGADEATEINLSWTAAPNAGNRAIDNEPLSPWRTYYIYYEECTNCNVTTNSPSRSFTNGYYASLGTNTATSAIFSNLNFDSTYRFVIAGQDRAGNLGTLSSTVDVTTLAFIVTQGLVTVTSSVDVSWMASPTKAYDALWVDGSSYDDSFSNYWLNLMGTVTNSWIEDGGSTNRAPPKENVSTMRFYRVSREGQWVTNANPRRASREIYVARTWWLSPGENWISLPFAPDTNRYMVKDIFGTNLLPRTASIATSTKISWYGHTLGTGTNSSGVATNEIWLSDANRWYYWLPTVLQGQVADTWRVATNEGFNIEIPTGSATQKYVIVGRLPTNEMTVTIYGANGQTNYSVLTWGTPRRTRVKEMGLIGASFSGGVNVTRSDEIRIMDNSRGMGSMMAPKARLWRNGATTNFYLSPANSVANDYVIEPGDAIIFVRKRGPNLVWTNKLYYTVPGKNINP